MNSVRPIMRHAWLLYSDLNSRFNTLLDEYAHLQTTIYGLLPSDIHESSLFDKKPVGDLTGPCERELQMKLPYRDVLDEQGDKCHAKPTAVRTYLSYISWLGTLIKGLEQNKEECLRAYTDFVSKSSIEASSSTSGLVEEAFFWFVAQRAHFIDVVFTFYAEQLEHAHEKLIQVMENFPGATPQPILLRRWNSAAYEEFLSSYFAHSKWRVRELVKELLGDESVLNGNLTHSWAHAPTSEVNRFVLNWNEDGPGDIEHGAVQSAFFYLEQPALFPLLLHESAHFYFPTDEQVEEHLSRARDEKKRIDTFFVLRMEAADTLRNTYPFAAENRDWSDAFTKEVWIDAISVRLGGVPYVAALFSQILGKSSPAHYQHTKGEDGILELAPLGTYERRLFEVHYPEGCDEYLWEARLSLAIRLCKILGTDRAGAAELAWLDSCSNVIALWQAGGAIANGRSRLSEEHETFWNYRREVNEWVEDVLWSYIEPSLGDLREHAPAWNYHFGAPEKGSAPWTLDRTNPVNSSPVEAIQCAVKSYLERALSTPDEEAEHLASNLDDMASIDACPLSVRWVVAGRLMESNLRLNTTQSIQDQLGNFADYVRHDGHTAFRMAMEWHLVRESFFADIARDLTQEEPRTVALANSNVPWESRKKLAAFFYQKIYDNSVAAFEDWCLQESIEPAQYPALYQLVQECMRLCDDKCKMVGNVLLGLVREGEEIPVGTLTLGLLRPAEVASGNTQSPYIGALRRARTYYESQDQLIEQKSGRKCCSSFVGLIGDYSFLHFLPGLTPVERDVHASGLPKMLSKPRAVIRVSPQGKMGMHSQSAKVGKVTLLRREYRHQWLDLLAHLEKDKTTEAYELYVSSGWEDLVLVTWHTDMLSLRKARYTQDLVHKGTCLHDAQSSVAFFLEDVVDPKPWGWRDGLKDNCQYVSTCPWLETPDSACDDPWSCRIRVAKSSEKTGIESLHETIGRYDYSIAWERMDTKQPADVVVLLGMLPRKFWDRVTSYSTGIREDILKNDAESDYITRFVLN